MSKGEKSRECLKARIDVGKGEEAVKPAVKSKYIGKRKAVKRARGKESVRRRNRRIHVVGGVKWRKRREMERKGLRARAEAERKGRSSTPG